MNSDKFVEVTLRLTPAAYGLLVAMAARDERVSVEDAIMRSLAGDIASFCEAIGDSEQCKELFLTGKVTPAKEAA